MKRYAVRLTFALLSLLFAAASCTSFKQSRFVLGTWDEPYPDSPPPAGEVGYREYCDYEFNTALTRGDGSCTLWASIDAARHAGLDLVVKARAPANGCTTVERLNYLLPETDKANRKLGCGYDPVAGYLLADDVHPAKWLASACKTQLVDGTTLLSAHKPPLFPWIIHSSLSYPDVKDSENPILALQIYSAYWLHNLSIEMQSYGISQSLELCRVVAEKIYRETKRRMLIWPLVSMLQPNHFDMDLNNDAPLTEARSLGRFSAYAALAYGAGGLWYYDLGGMHKDQSLLDMVRTINMHISQLATANVLSNDLERTSRGSSIRGSR